MELELFELVSLGKKIEIDSDVNIPDTLISDSSIRRLNNVHFKGCLSKLVDDSYELVGLISGTMIIPDDITLEDYAYDFTSEVDEKIEESSIKLKKTLDITDILWQNIVVEVPLKAVNEKNKDLTMEGNGWRLIREDEVDSANHPLSELEDLLRKE